MKKILMWAGIAFLVFFVAFNPKDAGNVVSTIGGVILAIAEGFGTFLGELF